jgi:hypothetical protein
MVRLLANSNENRTADILYSNWQLTRIYHVTTQFSNFVLCSHWDSGGTVNVLLAKYFFFFKKRGEKFALIFHQEFEEPDLLEEK